MGLALVLAAATCNEAALGAWLARDGRIEAPSVRGLVLAGQLALALAGLLLLVRGRAPRALLAARVPVLAVLVLAAGAGALGTLRALRRPAGTPAPEDGVRPWELSFPELCTWLTEGDNHYFGRHQITRYEEALAEAEAEGADVLERVRRRENLSGVLLRHGFADRALALLEEADRMAAEAGLDEAERNHVRRNLGVACLRRGEIDHCIAMHNPESCLFPIEPGGVWADPSGARAAIEVLREFLEHEPDDAGVRWLLNVAHMTEGTYPDGVDPRFLIPREIFEADGGVGRFRDVAADVGVATFGGAGGVILDDMDGDGRLDVVTSSMFPCLPLRYYWNRGDGTFEDRTEAVGFAEQLGGLSCNQTDFDNDGRLDVLVLRGAWMGEHGRQRNSLLGQRADGTFEDVTERAGLAEPAYPCQAAAWADYDLDGFLDLCIGNEEYPTQLYRNRGDGTFVDVAVEVGLENRAICKGVSWGDYDDDGDPDLYLSNLLAPNRLYRNEDGQRFVDRARALGVASNPTDAAPDLVDTTFASWFFDYQNDGRLDLYVGGYGASLAHVAADYLGLPSEGTRLRLYRNDGEERFVDVTREVGLHHVRLPMGANHGDVDNDGWPDIYLGTGKPGFEFLVPNVLYKNVAGRRFLDVTAQAGVGHLQKGHGIAFGDVDNDGDQDLFAQIGGFYPDDGFQDSLFENPGHGNHWLTVVLRGVTSNRPGIGARLRVVVDGPEGERSIHATGGSGASFGASSLQQEIGLGRAARILRLEVHWPASGALDVFADVPLDRFVRVTEGSPELELLERPAFELAHGG